MTADQPGTPEEPGDPVDLGEVNPEDVSAAAEAAANAEPAEAGEADGPAATELTPEEAQSAKEAELLADLQRLQAEYANYRRRADRERQGAVETGKATLISSLLPVLDDLDRARAHGDLEAGPLRGVADKIVDTLKSQGLNTFGAQGDAFDPALHEAVQHDGDGANPVIGDVYRQGYRLGERLLRTAMVTVTDAADADAGS
ncbi:nucleotide exchange factor GrpE [Williamsia maris]|uniref:Protein GrpE n=1 Tax=Williamsia maris TaxID=72806 RepID=A0ABT1HFM0_9NOCA|nr:nucleotide exchange factor GrpE [Williamsia maris]MCP2176531.1 molecular chaperone GrpE [Williamsia maris]